MKNKRKIFILNMISLIIILLSNSVYAFSVRDLPGKKIENADIDNLGNTIITIVSTIGSIISVVILVVIGIKYMLGSTEERASYKKSLMPYIIGAVLIFAASTVAGAIYNMINGL